MADLEYNASNGSSTSSSIEINKTLRCEICNINVPDQQTLKCHKKGKKHLKMLKASTSREKSWEGKEVYISRLGKLSQQDVRKYMSKYGKIVKVSEHKNSFYPNVLHSAFIEFETGEEVSNLLALNSTHKVPLSVPSNGPPRYQNILVSERTFKKKRERSPSPVPCPSVDHSILKLKLAIVSDCEEQINALVDHTQLLAQDVRDRENICINIQKTFCREYSGCIVYPFGSSVNGLGFRGCDLDVYIDIGNPPPMYNPNNPLVDVPVTMTEKQKVFVAARMLKSIPQCTKIHSIHQARVPIVKFVHRTSGIHCDISFKNRASVCNTQFIRLCNEADTRIRPVMFIIRYFAKRYDLAGGGGGMKMSNYALTMMIIFYLQQIDNPLLHPVSAYQDSIDVQPDIISGWNCAFTRDLSQLPPLPVNRLNVLDLIAGFFTFYANYNFQDLVMCPILGRSIARDDIVRGKSLPYPLNQAPVFVGKEGLQMEKPICLQDPFELCHNVCKNLPKKALTILRCFLAEAGDLCKAMINPDTRPAGGILPIFDLEITVPEELEPVNEVSVALAEETKESLSRYKAVVKIPFPAKFIQNEKTNFKDKAINLIRKIFSDCLKFEMKNGNLMEIETGNNENIGCDNIEQISEIGLKRSSSNYDDPTESIKRMRSIDDQIITDDSLDKDSTLENEETSNTAKLLIGLSCQEEAKGDNKCDPEKYNKRDEKLGDGQNDVCDEWMAWTPIWSGRKKIKTRMGLANSDEPPPPGTSGQDIFQIEADISEKIFKDIFGGKRLSEPEVVFQVHPIFNRIEQNPPVYQRCLWLGLEMVRSRKKTYETMFDWLGSYLPYIVGEIINSDNSQDDEH